MDKSAYEKLSIRESARSLKKYGSTSSKNSTRNESYIKHYVENTDTLQGIALKYNVTIEQIRRANRLWASDSLFLKEYLLIPSTDSSGVCSPSSVSSPSITSTPVVSPTQVTSPSSNSFDESIDDFLSKIDASIATTKEDVRKTQKSSEFLAEFDGSIDRRKPAVSRMKQIVNNNSNEMFAPPNTVVIQQGKKVRTSIQHHQQQQDELFEL